MKKLADQVTTSEQLQLARELMAVGQSDKALVVALSALQTALHNLKESLLSLQQHLGQMRANLRTLEAPQRSRELLPEDVKDRVRRIYH